MEHLERIVDRAQNGDKRAIAALYEEYVDAVYRYVYYRLFEKSETEDVTSEIFLRALRGIGGYRRDKGSLKGWLFGIARTTLADHYGQAARRAEVARNPEIAPIAADNPDVFMEQAVKSALAWLTEEQREVIVLRFYAGMTAGEVAVHMGKNESAVKALQRRSLAALAKVLGGGNDEK